MVIELGLSCEIFSVQKSCENGSARYLESVGIGL